MVLLHCPSAQKRVTMVYTLIRTRKGSCLAIGALVGGLVFVTMTFFGGSPVYSAGEALLQLHQTNSIGRGHNTTFADELALGARGAKRAVRNCIAGEVLFNTKELTERYVTDIKDVTFTPQKTETPNERQASFQKVFQNREWGKTGPVSGAGSTLYSAQEQIGILHSLIGDMKLLLKKERITMLDIPCGDMTWMKRFLDTRDDVDYTGMDIVPEIINGHKKTFAKKPWKFVHQDIVATPLKNSYDLIHVRQMLQHLTGRDTLTALRHFSASGHFLLATTYATIPSNSELNTKAHSRYRLQNLELPPFSLTRPLCYSRDGPPGHSNHLHFTGLWKLPLKSIRKCVGKFALTKIKLHGVQENLYSCNV